MIDLDRINQSPEERSVRDDEVAKIIRWLSKTGFPDDNGVKQTIITHIKRSAHRG